MRKNLFLAGSVLLFAATRSQGAVLDDFNTSNGHFNNAPTFSGSTTGLNATSTHTRISDGSEGPLEGLGMMKLDLDVTTAPMRLRYLSGGGTPANNVTITTSGGVDGWFGYYLKTSAPGTWTTQPWLEGASNNGGNLKTIINDGEWHLYEWNLDDNSGGADGWGSVPSINAGSAVVTDGAHTLDSIFIRGGTVSDNNIFYVDFVAQNTAGSVAQLVPEPSTYALATLGGLGMLLAARRRK